MGSAKRNLLTSILLLVVMGIFAVLTIFIVVDAINKKYYNDIKVEYEVQEEEDLNNVILTFARNEGSALSTSTVKAVKNPEDKTKFRIDGTVPEIQNGVVTNLDDLTSSDGREFYFFSTNSSFIDPQEDPENPGFIFSDTYSRYYVSTESDPIWYDVPKSSENLTLYSVFLTPNVHNSDFANAPLLNTSPNVIISHDVTEIPYNAFSNALMESDLSMAAKIESVVIPNSTKSINSEFDTEAYIIGGAFAACTTLTNIIIPGSVEYVGGEAFMFCTGLDTVEYENGYYLSTESNKHAVLIDTNLKATNVTIHEDCISIQGNTFSKYLSIMLGLIPPPDMGDGSNEEIMSNYININLQEISIPKNVKNIGFGAFMMCSGLTNVEFGENSNLTSIGYGSFADCSSLRTINLEDTKLEELGVMAFASMDELMPMLIEEITLPSTLKTIGEGAFGYCGSLKTVNFEDNSQLTSIGSSAFSNCSSLTSITIPSNVTSIGRSAFSRCSSLTSITIPESVMSIGDNAFYECSSLKTVTFGDNSQLTSIGDYAFSGCSSLTSITIPESVMSIGDYAFSDCSSLKTVTFGDNSQLTSIGDYAFSYCRSLISITIPDSVTSIGYNAFDRCRSLETVTFEGESQLTSIEYATFSYCESLTSITIPDCVTSIGDYAFRGCSSLTSIIIPKSVTSIGLYGYAFRECTGLTSITFENMTGLTNIGRGTFEACYNVKQLTIQSGEVKDLDFSDLGNLTTVILGDGVTSIGYHAFYNCRRLTSITIPESVTIIGSDAFSGCSKLTIYCEVESKPSGWSSDWNYLGGDVYWAGEWEYDEVTGEPRPIESGVESLSDIGKDFGIGFDGLGFREEIYFNDKRERKVV